MARESHKRTVGSAPPNTTRPPRSSAAARQYTARLTFSVSMLLPRSVLQTLTCGSTAPPPQRHVAPRTICLHRKRPHVPHRAGPPSLRGAKGEGGRDSDATKLRWRSGAECELASSRDDNDLTNQQQQPTGGGSDMTSESPSQKRYGMWATFLLSDANVTRSADKLFLKLLS